MPVQTIADERGRLNAPWALGVLHSPREQAFELVALRRTSARTPHKVAECLDTGAGFAARTVAS